MNKELIVPFLFNTYERPNKPNNYSVYIPKNEEDKCQIYINGKWFIFVATTVDETKQEELDEYKIVNEKEYNLIKAIREYMNKEEL